MLNEQTNALVRSALSQMRNRSEAAHLRVGKTIKGHVDRAVIRKAQPETVCVNVSPRLQRQVIIEYMVDLSATGPVNCVEGRVTLGVSGRSPTIFQCPCGERICVAERGASF